MDQWVQQGVLIGYVIIGFVVGLTFADIDLAPPLPVRHRSIFTHGPVVPLVLMWLVSVNPVWLWVVAGFAPGYIIHLLADMFPKSWRGSALVNLYPVGGALNGFWSFAVLGAGVAVSIGLWVPVGSYILEALL